MRSSKKSVLMKIQNFGEQQQQFKTEIKSINQHKFYCILQLQQQFQFY